MNKAQNIQIAPPAHTDEILWRKRVVWLIIGIGLLRLIMARLNPVDLFGDEAQYWSWSRDLEWGYFSKPPLIAWIIAITTSVFGHSEWAVRLASPLLHMATAYLLFLIGRKAYSARTGFWAAAIYFLMPAVWLSSNIISTDVPLLLCWALALLTLLKLRDEPSLSLAILLGASIGMGLLAKYAMLFFFPALVFALLTDKPTRRAFWGKNGLIAALIIAALITPNILWNIDHDMVTFSHTADNSGIDKFALHPLELLEFFTSQFIVFGPLSFGALIAAFMLKKSERAQHPNQNITRIFIAFAIAPLLIICVQALANKANANWAVSAYIAGSVLAAHFITSLRPKWLNPSRNVLIGLSVIFAAILSTVMTPNLPDRLGFSNSLKDVRGWEETSAQIGTRFSAGIEGESFTHIAMDHRLSFFELEYYTRDNPLPLTMWRKDITPHHHADMAYPLADNTQGPILVLSRKHYLAPLIEQDFYALTPLDDVIIELGGGKSRRFKAWAGYGYERTKIAR